MRILFRFFFFNDYKLFGKKKKIRDVHILLANLCQVFNFRTSAASYKGFEMHCLHLKGIFSSFIGTFFVCLIHSCLKTACMRVTV